MGFNKSKDKVIGIAGTPMEVTVDGQGQRITVGVYQYNGGVAKIGINRMVVSGSETRPSKLGRVTIDEAEYIARQLPEAIRILKKHIGEG